MEMRLINPFFVSQFVNCFSFYSIGIILWWWFTRQEQYRFSEMKESLGLDADSKVLLVTINLTCFLTSFTFLNSLWPLSLSTGFCSEFPSRAEILPQYKIPIRGTILLRSARRATQTLKDSWKAFGVWRDKGGELCDNWINSSEH